MPHRGGFLSYNRGEVKECPGAVARPRLPVTSRSISRLAMDTLHCTGEGKMLPWDADSSHPYLLPLLEVQLGLAEMESPGLVVGLKHTHGS